MPAARRFCFACVLGVLALWHWSLGSVSVDTVTSPKAEAFYWATITFSQTLGTALGDWMADSTGLGYLGGAAVFAVGLAVLAVLYFTTRVSRVFLFWAAFILTRPLGATLGDFLDKPLNHGGLDFQPAARLAHHRRRHGRADPHPAAARRTPSRPSAKPSARKRRRAHDDVIASSDAARMMSTPRKTL